MKFIIPTLIIALTALSSCSAVVNARKIKRQHAGYCMKYMYKNTKEIVFCASSKPGCQAMVNRVKSKEWAVTAPCSLY